MKRLLRSYLDAVSEYGCIVCGSQTSLHHPRFAAGMAQRSPDWLVIPLCPNHHQHGGHGVAIHAGQATFEQNYGSEAELLAKTIERAWLHRK